MLKKKLIAITFLFISLTILSCFAQKQNAGIITDFSGTVKYKVANSSEYTDCFLLLNVKGGDIFILEKKSKLTVSFISDGHRETVTGPAKIKISDKKIILLVGKNTVSTIKPLSNNTNLKVKPSNIERLGGYVCKGFDPEIIIIKSLTENVVEDVMPKFEWSKPIKDVDTYRISLKDETGKTLWSKETKETYLNYPEVEKKLEYGKKYRWLMEALYNGQVYTAGGFDLNVLSENDINELKNAEIEANLQQSKNINDISPSIILLNYYYGNKLYRKAAILVDKLLKIRPDDENLQALQSDIDYKRSELNTCFVSPLLPLPNSNDSNF